MEREPDPHRLGLTIDPDIPDTRQGFGDLVTAGTASPGTLGEHQTNLSRLSQPERKTSREQIPERQDLLARVLQRADPVTPAARPCDSSSDNAAAIRRLRSRSVTYAVSEAISSTTRTMNGSSVVGLWSRENPRIVA